jgi:hypothetical protein
MAKSTLVKSLPDEMVFKHSYLLGDALYYSKYRLQIRKYLGPTSTDNVLSFLMVICSFKIRLISVKFNLVI